MKRLIILISLIFSVSIISAQKMPIDSLGKNEIKKKKKEEKEAKLQKQYEEIYKMLFNRSFVLEASYIERIGNKYIVNQKLNFLMVDSTNAILQLGSLYGIGYNGIGGETAKGKISTYKLTRNDKKKTCSLMMTVLTPIYTFNVSFDIRASGAGTAWISGMYFGLILYDGFVVPLKEAKVIMGNSFN
jgi:hypothetical protein